jgi:hypothetical protein
MTEELHVTIKWPRKVVFHYEVPEELQEWYDECSRLVLEAAHRLQVPMERREIELWYPSSHSSDFPDTHRITADWYSATNRYGFKIKWSPYGEWPTPEQILEKAIPFLKNQATCQIEEYARYVALDAPNDVTWAPEE